MAILIVGDRKVIEAGLRSLDGIGGTLAFLDADGRPITGDGDSGESGGGTRP
jgi:hypothetical protein